MVNNRIDKISTSLKGYNFFQECIIEEVIFKDYLTTLEISLNNIWTNEGTIRNDLDKEKDIVLLRFKGLDSFQVRNYLTSGLKTNLDKINWGFNEISIVKVENASEGFIKFSFLWESNRTIELIFSEFELIKPR
jgi:hypothetical protein